jgi:hypothetical protein
MLTRIATIIAVLDFRDEVSLDDVMIAGSLAVQSFEVSCLGIEKYMVRFLDFPQYCGEVENLLREGPMSKSDLRAACRRFQRYGYEFDRVMAWLVSEGTVEEIPDVREAGFGRPSPGYRLRKTEEPPRPSPVEELMATLREEGPKAARSRSILEEPIASAKAPESTAPFRRRV